MKSFYLLSLEGFRLISLRQSHPFAAIPIRQIKYEACDSNNRDFVVRHKTHSEGCPILVLEEVDNYSQAMSSDVCFELVFCCACCSNYGGKTVSTDYAGCSYVDCQESARKTMRNHVSPRITASIVVLYA